MRVQIRRGVFETNSSSTHCISIVCGGANLSEKEGMDCLEFKLGEFGWEWENYHSPEDKASYLWTAIIHLNFPGERDYKADSERISKWLGEEGIEAIFDDTKCSWNNEYFGGYVDHTEDLLPFIEYVLESKEHLLNFLFDWDSCIRTGNDNDDDEVCFATMPEGKQAMEFYKGN